MGNERRFRRLVVDGTVWHWTVRQRSRPDYRDCRVTLSFSPEAPAHGVRRRLSLVFAPGPGRVISNSYFEAGTVVRLPDRAWLNLYEPGTARRLLDAAAPVLEISPSVRDLEVDGWPYFAEVVDRADSDTEAARHSSGPGVLGGHGRLLPSQPLHEETPYTGFDRND